MDVRIEELVSNLHLTDARAMLKPEVLDEITRAVAARLRQDERVRQARDDETRVERRALELG